MRLKFSLLFWGIATVMLLAGCGATRHGPGDVAKMWSCKLREMQIRPVFPPREDVYVGDVYWLPHAKRGTAAANSAGDGDADAYCNWSAESDFMRIGSHLAFVSQVGAKLEQHYQSRPSLPASGTSSISISGVASEGFVVTASSRTTAPTESTSLFSLGVSNRTRLVAFPDFMTVDVDQASFGALGTVTGLPFGLAGSSKSSESVRISVPVAESYGLPLLPLVSALQASLTATGSLCDPTMSAVLDKDFRDKELGAIHVVQEVFYARAMDIDMDAEQARALGVGLDSGPGVVTTTSPPFVTPTTTGNDASGAGGGTAMAETAVKAALDQLTSRGGLPGVTVSRSAVHQGRIHMRRVFDRPVAIGMRSVALKIDPAKQGACLVGVLSLGGTPPSTTMTVSPDKKQ